MPSATIIGLSTICLQPTTTLQYTSNITSVDAIATYKWSIDTDSVGNAVNLNYNYRTPGNHVVKLDIKTINGCTFSVTKNILIDSIVTNFSVTPVRFCGSGTSSFTNLTTSFGAINLYDWRFGDGNIAAIQNPTNTYNLPGNYTVQLIAATINGCRDTTKFVDTVKVFNVPSATIIGDSIHCTPGLYTYTSTISSVDPIIRYQWFVDGIQKGIGNSLSHNYFAGNHIISLKITTSNGCSDSVSRRINIDSVVAKFTIINPKICGDTGTVRFINLSTSVFNNITYQWNFGDGQFSTQINPSHFYASAANYLATLKATTANGCSSLFAFTDTIIIYPTTTIGIVGVNEKCVQNSLLYKANILSADVVTNVTWLLNSNVVSNSDSLQYYFNTAGNYNIQLAVATKYGCNTFANKLLVIHPLPVPAAAPDTTICLGGSLTLRSFDGTIYLWDAAPGLQNLQSSNPFLVPTNTSNYSVTVTNQFGCIKRDTIRVQVDNPVKLQVNKNDSICIGESIRLNAVANSNRYAWSPVDGLNNSIIANPLATPTQTTNYQVIAFSNTVCKNDTGFVKIFVGNKPIVNAGVDRNIVNGTPIQLQAQVNSTDVNKYTWSPSTGLSCTNCPNPSFIADNDITYKVTAQTIYGCTAEDEVKIAVFCGKQRLYIPNAFSPNKDGLNDRFYIKGYGIAQIKNMVIFNRWGQKVFEKHNILVNDPTQGWDGKVNGMPADGTEAFVYVLEVVCKDGQKFNYKGTIMLIR